MKQLGIIGYGHFGKFTAVSLTSYFDVKVYSANAKENEWSASLAEVARCDYLVLSLPLSKHAEACEQIKPLLARDTIIVDVCSVKEESGLIIKQHLPRQRLLSTHPLFGPESAVDSIKGHTIVLCDDMTDPELVDSSHQFFEQIGLNVIVMPSHKHDIEMALVQGLTFFIARVLKDFDLNGSVLETPSFKKLIALAELEHQHTEDLFATIQNGNHHTNAVRKKFIDRARELHLLLEEDNIRE